MSGCLPVNSCIPRSILGDAERIKAGLERPAPGWTTLPSYSMSCNMKIAKDCGAFVPRQLAIGFA